MYFYSIKYKFSNKQFTHLKRRITEFEYEHIERTIKKTRDT